jgi:RHS repeat-associated protein
VDEPLVWYEGSGVADRRWLHADRQGSIIGVSNGAGAVTPYAYGPWGEPSDWTGPRFRYTGQAAFPEAQAYHYKARVYDPAMGRFLQTDPIGQADDPNLYAYVRGDPVNKTDPTGACPLCAGFGALVGGSTSAVFEVGYQVAESGKITDLGAVGTAGLGGFVGGAIAGGTGCVSCGGAAAGFVTSTLDSIRDDGKIDAKDAVRIGTSSAAGGTIARVLPGANKTNFFGKTQASSNMLLGKFTKGSISKISPSTAAKIGANEAVKASLSGTLGKGIDKLVNCATEKDKKC